SLMISFRSLTGLISMMEIIVKISAIQQLTFSRFRDLLTVGCPTCGVLGLPNIERNQKHLRKALVFPDIGVTNGSAGWTTYGTFLVVVLASDEVLDHDGQIGGINRLCQGDLENGHNNAGPVVHPA